MIHQLFMNNDLCVEKLGNVRSTYTEATGGSQGGVAGCGLAQRRQLDEPSREREMKTGRQALKDARATQSRGLDDTGIGQSSKAAPFSAPISRPDDYCEQTRSDAIEAPHLIHLIAPREIVAQGTAFTRG
uniref:Uncharacterized protein n=1 Tax=Plectus sambesii TaxID=2011161 RepID=A0A914XI35_9BILA